MDYGTLQASVISHEGTGPVKNGRFMPYPDSKGCLTIGYGECIGKTGISQAAAVFLLNEALQVAIGDAQKQVWWELVKNNDNRSNALVEILFQLGLPTFNEFIEAIGYLTRSNWLDAADAFQNSAWFRESGDRAIKLVGQIRNG